MQLLKRSTVQTEVASQRQKQIDEGIRIAQKVDALRQTLGELEQQQARFLAGMEKELEERTQPLVRKIASLQKDIEDLEEKRRLLLEPLDAQWVVVNAKESELVELQTLLEKKTSEIVFREERTIELGTELKNRLFKVKTRERELDKTIRTASEELYIAQEKHVEAQKIKDAADTYSKVSKQELLTREADIAVREREVGMLRNHTNDRERELDERETLIKDREDTLERELNRRKK